MKINFKQPKYVLPLLALPFLCLFFYVWRSGSGTKKEVKPAAGLNSSVGSVSTGVRQKELAGKLDAYRNTYKEADGYTAVNVIPKEVSSNAAFRDSYTGKEKQMLDSIDRAMKAKYNTPPPGHDKALAGMLNSMPRHALPAPAAQPPREKDPMDIFRQQMSYMDSVSKINDPAYKAEQAKKLAAEKTAQLKAAERYLPVNRAATADTSFNTVKPATESRFISAVIDESITGYAGSRLRLRLLEPVRAGSNLIPQGTYLFAQISGFSEQRVTLSITTILSGDQILPVKLQVYDLDGLPGLYVPSSAFREFTRDLGSNSVQGVTIDGNSSGSQFLMSSMDKMFQSTSSAIAGLIRKNKAKLKYNSYIYLIDADALQRAQQAR